MDAPPGCQHRHAATRPLMTASIPAEAVTKPGSKRAVAKKAIAVGATPANQPSAPSIEPVVVDMVKEPVEGVVITELETTEMRGPNPAPEQPEQSPGAARPESESRAA